MKKTTEEPKASDPFSTVEVIKLVIQKLASQSLLFGLAVIVILAASWKLFGKDSLPLVGAVLFVFTVALLGFLFKEQRKKIEDGAFVSHPPPNTAPVAHAVDEIRNSNPAFTVHIWTAAVGPDGARDISVLERRPQSSFHLGDKIVVGFRANRDCYVTILNVGTSGKLTVLFPNALHPDHFVRANTDHSVPAPDDGFEYQLLGPPGRERLKALATLEKVTLLETHFTKDGALFHSVPAAEGARDIKVVKRNVEQVPLTQWAEGACEFTVT